MSLTKQDLVEIKGVVDGSIKEAVKDFPTRTEVREIVNDVVTKESEELARIMKLSFDDVDRRFEKVDRTLSEIKFDLSTTVHRPEFLEVRERVEKLERKVQ